MRYVIVSVVDDTAGEFNERIRREVYEKFKAKSSKLPAHITVKAPFEYDKDIAELENVIEKFCSEYKKVKYDINGYGAFDKRAIYMNVVDNKELRELHRSFVRSINEIEYINLGANEGEGAVFHITIASKKIKDSFHEIWDYVHKTKCLFKSEFNNITIFIWKDNTWKVYKKYNLK